MFNSESSARVEESHCLSFSDQRGLLTCTSRDQEQKVGADVSVRSEILEGGYKALRYKALAGPLNPPF